MNSVVNKTQLAGKRYKDKLKKEKEKNRLKNKNLKKQNKNFRKSKEEYKKYNRQLQKTKKTTKLQKKKQYELIKRRTLIRKQNESNKEIKQNERLQKRKNLVEEDIGLGRFFKLATTNKKYVNGLYLHEIESEILGDSTGGFELIGSMLIGGIEQKTSSGFKNTDDFEAYNNAIDNDGYDSESVVFTG